MSEAALLRPDEAASWLGRSRSALYRLVRERRLIAVKPFGAGELRFRHADLETFVASLPAANQETAVPAESAAQR